MPMKNNLRLAINLVFIQGAYQTARARVHLYLPVSLKYKIRVDYYKKTGDKHSFIKKRMLLVPNDIASFIGSERLHGLAHEILVRIAYVKLL